MQRTCTERQDVGDPDGNLQRDTNKVLTDVESQSQALALSKENSVHRCSRCKLGRRGPETRPQADGALLCCP